MGYNYCVQEKTIDYRQCPFYNSNTGCCGKKHQRKLDKLTTGNVTLSWKDGSIPQTVPARREVYPSEVYTLSDQPKWFSTVGESEPVADAMQNYPQRPLTDQSLQQVQGVHPQYVFTPMQPHCPYNPQNIKK